MLDSDVNIRKPVFYCIPVNQYTIDLYNYYSFFQDAIGCLASVTDSSIAKNIFITLLGKFHFIDGRNEFSKVESHTDASGDEETYNQCTREKDAQR